MGFGGNQAQDRKFSNSCAGDEDALGVGAGVWGRQEQAGAFDQGAVIGSYAFQFVAVFKNEPQPKAGKAWAACEVASQEAFGLLACVAFGGKLADVTEPFDLVPVDAQETAAGIEKLERGFAGGIGWGKWIGGGVTGQPVPSDLAYDHGFTGGGHWLDCRMRGTTAALFWCSVVAKLVTV